LLVYLYFINFLYVVFTYSYVSVSLCKRYRPSEGLL
jgi:hypothetical protein